ncbi:MAG: M60 family metallopeptidase [Planctomycetota bacterium]|nr:M60 family metallopeptidase [Planctomycetota bacterium]
MRTAPAIRLAAILLTLLVVGPRESAADGPALPAGDTRDVAAMLEGVGSVAMPGIPGNVTVFGPDAFPVIAGRVSGRPAVLVGAARYGRGRAVLFGHGYFAEGALRVGDTRRLIANVTAWAGGKSGARVGVREWKDLGPGLTAVGFSVVTLDGPDWTDRLRDVDVVFTHLAQLTEAEVEVMTRRIRAGLGVVSGMPGWGWQQLNPRLRLAEDNPCNRLLAPAGLVWGGDYLEKPSEGALTVSEPAPALSHAGLALEALLAHDEGDAPLVPADAALAVSTVARAIRELPAADKLLLPRLGRLLKHADDPRYVPTAARPLGDEHGLGKLLLTLQVQRDRLLPPAKIKAHPAAAAFPGDVPRGTRTVRVTHAVDLSVPGWHSTGAYAPAGEVVAVRVPSKSVGAGLELRIGAHQDALWHHARWSRVPEITVQRPLDDERTEHGNAYGGLVYVVVPPGGSAGTVDIELRGVVPAPHFVLGTTSNEAWRESLRAAPAPWAELESAKLIITVPSEHVRGLEDPEALMLWWDRMMDGCADLSAIPHERARPERYVADVQISAGYMHAGYPIMTHLDAAPRFVDLATLSTAGDWGMFHEMGHNHQRPEWTFDGTTEVTCNLYSLYLMETLCSKGIGHEAMSTESIYKNRTAYEIGGRAFGLWKAQPFTALIMYQHLRTAFGWDAYKRVFAEYRDLPDVARPKTDDDKRDQWLVRMSKTVGHDLGPFFESWGIPVSDAARGAVASLPKWMPPDPK